MIMNGKQQEATELEAQLEHLTALVRERRQQLARLEKCPNKDCPCRRVWRDHVEKNLAGQVGEIRRQVRSKPARSAKAPRSTKPGRVTATARRGSSRGKSAKR
jgi:hypothetical protein